MKLFDSFTLRDVSLKNRVVMSPMTRCRAIDHIPNSLMAKYYAQRAGAGLIITEGTAPSPNGIGYARIPGMYNRDHVAGWLKVTEAVHDNGGKIFLQIMHTGRVSHPLNMPDDATIMAPSAIQLSGKMYTDQEGEQPYPTPKEMTREEVIAAEDSFVTAARYAMEAGFDGVELHGANGYLIDQFNNPASNKREDEYGGSIENRSRFALAVAAKVVHAIGAEKVGIRLSPNGAMNDMDVFDDTKEQFTYLAKKFNELNMAYIHLVDHEAMGAPAVPYELKKAIWDEFDGTRILSGGYNKEQAEQDLQDDKGDLVAFGRPYIANPDLVYRMQNDLELNEPDQDTFYSAGAEGYTDYEMAGVPS
ncbi:alkene reductase [Gangjinia marincola]|uniref:Alkene reductase n=1 Tax=Gangjinia marincola TaxID=578463 RepID=A0ABN1MH01_9FLAO